MGWAGKSVCDPEYARDVSRRAEQRLRAVLKQRTSTCKGLRMGDESS